MNARDDQRHESDTESLVGMNGSEGPSWRRLWWPSSGLSLDEIHLETEFRTKANLMLSAPKFLEGAHLSALRLAMEEIRQGRRTNNEARRIRGWKLFLLIPRMLLVNPGKGV